jgi:hypothetical protein
MERSVQVVTARQFLPDTRQICNIGLESIEDFAVLGRPVPPALPTIRFLYVGPRFCSTVASAPSRNDTLALRCSFTSIELDQGLAPSNSPTYLAYHKKRPSLKRGASKPDHLTNGLRLDFWLINDLNRVQR